MKHFILPVCMAVAVAFRYAYPDLFADVDVGQALRMLAEEAAGAPPTGIFYYSIREE